MLTLASRPLFQTLLDAIALTNADESPAITYVETDAPPIIVSRRQFQERVKRCADGLLALGIKPRQLVIIAHTQSMESIYLFWGAMAAGVVPSMFPTLTEKLDAAVYLQNMAQLVKNSNAAAVLTTNAFAPPMREIVECPVYTLTPALSPLEEKAGVRAGANPAATAFLQHSSGTTGLQKGVALSHTAVLNQLANYSDALRLQKEDVVVSWLPLYHDMGLIAGFLLPLMQGIPLVLMSPFDWAKHPALLFHAIRDYQGTLCWMPNFGYNHCARRIRKRDREGFSLNSMRLFINCSEPVRDDSHRLFLDAFAPVGARAKMLAVSYAMAENTFAVTQTPPNQAATTDCVDRNALQRHRRANPIAPDAPNGITHVSCGRPITGTAVRVIDEQGVPLPERRVGQLAVKSDCMLTGYYEREDLRPFAADGWYLTGDMGYLANGEVYVIGRSKDLIINAGKNVYPQDIEAIVNGVAGVHAGRAVVFGVEDAREGTELIAVIAEVESDDPERRKAINKAIRQAVGQKSGVAASFVHLVGAKWLLKTSSGKIARAANKEKWEKERGHK